MDGEVVMTMMEVVTNDLTAAMKEQDKFTLSVLRMLKSALQLEKISKKHDLDDNEVIAVIKKQVKTRKDSIVEFEKFNKTEEVEKLNKEIDIRRFLQNWQTPSSASRPNYQIPRQFRVARRS